MKADVSLILAKKYARAFMNLYADQITVQVYQKIPSLELFFRNNSAVLSLLSIPHISHEKKIDSLALLLAEYELPALFLKIVSLVLTHKRSALLPSIFHYIYQMYQEQHRISECIIYSAHALSDNDQQILVQFLSAQTGTSIVYTHIIDPSLIAGVRLQGKTFLWEWSINQRLKAISHAFIKSY